MLTLILTLAWVVIFLSIVFPLTMAVWMMVKGGRAFTMDVTRHDRAVREVFVNIPGINALRHLNRYSGWALAILVVVYLS